MAAATWRVCLVRDALVLAILLAVMTCLAFTFGFGLFGWNVMLWELEGTRYMSALAGNR